MTIAYSGEPTSLGKKDPDSKVDYKMDWSAYMAALGNDTIMQSEWLVVGSMVIASSPGPSFTDTETTVWIEGGGAVGESNTITNRVTTAGGRIEDRSFVLTVAEL
jgi:hypothetical protein